MRIGTYLGNHYSSKRISYRRVNTYEVELY